MRVSLLIIDDHDDRLLHRLNHLRARALVLYALLAEVNLALALLDDDDRLLQRLNHLLALAIALVL